MLVTLGGQKVYNISVPDPWLLSSVLAWLPPLLPSFQWWWSVPCLHHLVSGKRSLLLYSRAPFWCWIHPVQLKSGDAVALHESLGCNYWSPVTRKKKVRFNFMKTLISFDLYLLLVTWLSHIASLSSLKIYKFTRQFSSQPCKIILKKPFKFNSVGAQTFP